MRSQLLRIFQRKHLLSNLLLLLWLLQGRALMHLLRLLLPALLLLLLTMYLPATVTCSPPCCCSSRGRQHLLLLPLLLLIPGIHSRPKQPKNATAYHTCTNTSSKHPTLPMLPWLYLLLPHGCAAYHPSTCYLPLRLLCLLLLILVLPLPFLLPLRLLCLLLLILVLPLPFLLPQRLLLLLLLILVLPLPFLLPQRLLCLLLLILVLPLPFLLPQRLLLPLLFTTLYHLLPLPSQLVQPMCSRNTPACAAIAAAPERHCQHQGLRVQGQGLTGAPMQRGGEQLLKIGWLVWLPMVHSTCVMPHRT
jgi:hypothetical protein